MQYQSNGSTWSYVNSSDQTLKAASILPIGAARELMNPIILDIPADLAHVHLLSRCACALLENITHLEEPETSLYNLELAIQEVGVNIIKHAYAQMQGRIHMTLLLEE